MKLALKRDQGQLVLVASIFSEGPTAFIGAVYRSARGDQPIKFSLHRGVGDMQICRYDALVPEATRRQHASAVATALSVDLHTEG